MPPEELEEPEGLELGELDGLELGELEGLELGELDGLELGELGVLEEDGAGGVGLVSATVVQVLLEYVELLGL